MNVLTVAEIKRGGFAVLDGALAHGPVHLMKRNRPSAVLLSVDDYSALVKLANANRQTGSATGLSLLLAADASFDGLDAAGMQTRLSGLHEGWADR
jgi:PHD/YefM family antitoxin component YafN of YafNO toxin-antitoxin module